MTVYHLWLKLFLALIFTFTSLSSFSFSVHDSATYLHPIHRLESDKYAGDGIDWLLNKQDSTHFYLFGEQHGISDIPKFTNFVHHVFNLREPVHLALEIDSWTANKIAEMGVDGVFEKYPFSVAFDYDEDINLIRLAQDKTPVWGVDQMLTAMHPYQRLAEISSSEAMRRLAQGAYLKAALKQGGYMRLPNHQDISAIRETFNAETPKEAYQIIEHLQMSMKIYNAWEAANRGEISYLKTNELRESFMKDEFDAYRDLYSKEKVLVKIGGAHIVDGIGSNGVETLGTHIKEYASNIGLNSLSISLFNYNDKLGFVSKEIFDNSDIVLFDCAAFLQGISTDEFENLSSSDQLMLKGYDAIVLFNNAPKSSRTTVIDYEQKFKSNIIKNLILGAVLLLCCFSSLVPLSIFTFSKLKHVHYRQYGRTLALFFIVSLMVMAITIYQIVDLMNLNSRSHIVNSVYSLGLFVILLITGFYFIHKVIVFAKTQGKLKHKVSLGFYALSFLSVVVFLYYWNLGGMLSF